MSNNHPFLYYSSENIETECNIRRCHVSADNSHVFLEISYKAEWIFYNELKSELNNLQAERIAAVLSDSEEISEDLLNTLFMSTNTKDFIKSINVKLVNQTKAECLQSVITIIRCFK